MLAIVQSKYGKPEKVLRVAEIEKPTAGPGEVLVRVAATSVHPDVWHVVTGHPYVLRLMGAGWWRPKATIPGTDMSGTVESIGDGATRFQPGDQVFGEVVQKHQWKNGGAFAEYVSVPEASLMLNPSTVSFSEAAALPTPGLIALMNLAGGPQPGEHVLVNGAGGGVGTLLVQIAKARGAHVTGVDNTERLELVSSIGADRVIDYTQEDFTKVAAAYDLIVDIPGNRSINDLKRVMAPGGRYVLIGHDQFGSGNRWFGSAIGRFLRLAIFAPLGRGSSAQNGVKHQDQMSVLAELVESGSLSPVIDSSYPLTEIHAAFQHMTSGTALGRIVLTVDDQQSN